MTLITFEDGKPLMKEDGTIGSEQECCCEREPCTCGWTALADGNPPDPETCQCPEILGGGISIDDNGLCFPCPTTAYLPFQCLADAQAFAANYPEANWSFEMAGGDECDALLDENFCFPDAEGLNCGYRSSNPLP